MTAPRTTALDHHRRRRCAVRSHYQHGISLLTLIPFLYAIWHIQFVLQSEDVTHHQSPTAPLPRSTSGFAVKLVARRNSTAPAFPDSVAPPAETATHATSSPAGAAVDDAAAAAADLLDADNNNNIHVVFSTGCSAFQDWQSYALFYHLHRVGQPGYVTRVASGCVDAHAEQTLREAFAAEIVPISDRFVLHVTPDYTRAHYEYDNNNGTTTTDNNTSDRAAPYKFFNKPLGLRHWLQHGTVRPNNRALVVILDPDQLPLRPFTPASLKVDEHVWKGGVQLPDDATETVAVQPGHPVAQLYGFGGAWINDLDWTQVFGGRSTRASQISHHQVRLHYAAGPPYIAYGADMLPLVHRWADLVVPMYVSRPQFLTEMYAYSLAAMDLELPHQLATTLMASDVTMHAANEAWFWIDALPDDQVCPVTLSEPDDDPTTTITTIPPPPKEPHVLHYCQRYFLGPYVFNKYRIPTTLIDCDAPLLPTPPPADVMLSYNSSVTPDGVHHDLSPLHVRRMAYMLCHLLPRLNQAATFYKQQHCQGPAPVEASQ